jgi:hypothetical protein
MKLWPLLAVLAALGLSCCQFATAEEKPGRFITALSSTTVRGYINTSAHWQRHVCQPVRPVRAHRLYRASTNGVIREIGYAVRCRHGVVYLPNGIIAELLPTPNRSSRFAFDATMPRIDHQTQFVLLEANRISRPRRPDRPFPPLPPLPPPTLQTNWPPVVIQPRPPPTNSVTLPPVIVVPPINGSTGVEANRQRSDIPNDGRRLPPSL